MERGAGFGGVISDLGDGIGAGVSGIVEISFIVGDGSGGLAQSGS